MPVVVADHSDRTGNSTWILAELIKQGARNFCITTLSDERALAQLASKQAGDEVNLKVGGWAEATSGTPVAIDGTLEWVGPYGRMDRMAVVRFGAGNRVILTPVLHQVTDPAIFGAVGLDVAKIDIIVLKSRVHFWRGFVEDGLAKAVFQVDAPGLGPADVSTIPYKFAPRTLYPIDRQAKQQK